LKKLKLQPQSATRRPIREKRPGTYSYDAVNVSYWPSRDPIGEFGGVNKYGMVVNNTVNGIDLLGLFEYDGGDEPFTPAKQEKAESCTIVAAVNLYNLITGENLTEDEFIKEWRKDPDDNKKHDFEKVGCNLRALLKVLNQFGKKKGWAFKWRNLTQKEMDKLTKSGRSFITTIEPGHAIVIDGIWTKKLLKGYVSKKIDPKAKVPVPPKGERVVKLSAL